MWTWNFWMQTLERALKTFAQTWGATLAAGYGNLLDVGWKQSLAVAGFATLLALLTSIGSAGVGSGSTPSLVRVNGR